ncbi:hypothetical protein [Streptomyces sp. NPDC018031]|uniref:hypothetical protein n=1 Tax=Streptomyces sp. NPDC018031 TaxID=3365033 RepID=UPI0037909A03
MSAKESELAFIDVMLSEAEAVADEFDGFDVDASLQRIARRAVSRAADEMDHRARLAAASGARIRSEFGPQPVYQRAAASLEKLSSQVVRDPGTVEAMARLVDDRSRIEPAGALTFACLLYLSDRPEGAQFWWQFAAGAGVATAAYCLYLHHAQYCEDSVASFWHREALALRDPAGEDLYSSIELHTPAAVGPVAAARAEATSWWEEQITDPALGTVVSWALDHAKIADAVCRLKADTDEDYGLVPRPDPALAAELEEHFEHAP